MGIPPPQDSLYLGSFPQVEEVSKMKVGNPLDRDTNHGPQNHRAHLQKLLEYCQRGVQEGATLVCGGKQVPRPGQYTRVPVLCSGGKLRQQDSWPLVFCPDVVTPSQSIPNLQSLWVAEAIFRLGSLLRDGSSQDSPYLLPELEASSFPPSNQLSHHKGPQLSSAPYTHLFLLPDTHEFLGSILATPVPPNKMHTNHQESPYPCQNFGF